MRIQCPTCGARYQVADTAIPPGGRTVQCGSCNGTWFQSGQIVPDPEAVAAQAAPAATVQENAPPPDTARTAEPPPARQAPPWRETPSPRGEVDPARTVVQRPEWPKFDFTAPKAAAPVADTVAPFRKTLAPVPGTAASSGIAASGDAPGPQEAPKADDAPDNSPESVAAVIAADAAASTPEAHSPDFGAAESSPAAVAADTAVAAVVAEIADAQAARDNGADTGSPETEVAPAPPKMTGRHPAHRDHFPREDWELELDSLPADDDPDLTAPPVSLRRNAATDEDAETVPPNVPDMGDWLDAIGEASPGFAPAPRTAASGTLLPETDPDQPIPTRAEEDIAPGPTDAATARVVGMLSRGPDVPPLVGAQPVMPVNLHTPPPVMPRTTNPSVGERQRPPAPSRSPERQTGFATGLSLPLLVFVVALAAYGLRDQISATVPETAPWLEEYAVRVDQTRTVVQSGWQQAVTVIRDLAASSGLL